MHATAATADGLTQLIREVLTHHMLEVAAEPVIVVNNDDHIIIVSRSIAELGWDPDDLIGRPWRDLLDGDATSPTRLLSSQIARSAPGMCTVSDALVRTKTGPSRRVQLVTYRLWLGDAGAPAIIVVQPARQAPQ